MMNVRKYLSYLFSTPALYRIYENGRGRLYTPSPMEWLSTSTTSYVIPVTALLSLYHRNYGYLLSCAIVYMVCKVICNGSRLVNPDYRTFLNTLHSGGIGYKNYDFEFKYFPTTYSCVVSTAPYVNTQNSTGPISYYVSWVVAHTFGIRLMYPGVIFGSLIKHSLDDAREKLVVEKRADRVKIHVTSETDDVTVDAVFINQTHLKTNKSQFLFICCEGNAGFYEIGMIGGAIAEGYSVLGWNHPGFGGSTGVPYPTTELTAAMGIMKYATEELHFDVSKIIMYGWSIGGFPATYIASQYPDIHYLILDATFDDVLPLALPRMPEIMSSLVVSTIRNHVNLDNKANLANYTGNIRLVRRTEDEIIADPPGVLPNNRGTHLLQYLVTRNETPTAQELTELINWINLPHIDESNTHKNRFISKAASMLVDVKTTHCTMLSQKHYSV